MILPGTLSPAIKFIPSEKGIPLARPGITLQECEREKPSEFVRSLPLFPYAKSRPSTLKYSLAFQLCQPRLRERILSECAVTIGYHPTQVFEGFLPLAGESKVNANIGSRLCHLAVVVGFA